MEELVGQRELLERNLARFDRMHARLDQSEQALRDMESGFGFFRKAKKGEEARAQGARAAEV